MSKVATTYPLSEDGSLTNDAVSDLGHKRRRASSAEVEREALLAVTLAGETPDNALIALRLAELAWIPKLGGTPERPVVLLSPPRDHDVSKRQVQRRIAAGEKLLGIKLPDRDAAASALRGARDRAETTWKAHDERLALVVRAGRDPEQDVRLLRLTAECFRLGAEICEHMPLKPFASIDAMHSGIDPYARAVEIDAAADTIEHASQTRERESYLAHVRALIDRRGVGAFLGDSESETKLQDAIDACALPTRPLTAAERAARTERFAAVNAASRATQRLWRQSGDSTEVDDPSDTRRALRTAESAPLIARGISQSRTPPPGQESTWQAQAVTYHLLHRPERPLSPVEQAALPERISHNAKPRPPPKHNHSSGWRPGPNGELERRPPYRITLTEAMPYPPDRAALTDAASELTGYDQLRLWTRWQGAQPKIEPGCSEAHHADRKHGRKAPSGAPPSLDENWHPEGRPKEPRRSDALMRLTRALRPYLGSNPDVPAYYRNVSLPVGADAAQAERERLCLCGERARYPKRISDSSTGSPAPMLAAAA